MIQKLFILITLLLSTQIIHTSDLQVTPDAGKNCPELIVSKGYPVETHRVHTDDGYILTLFRIPYGINSTFEGKRKPVLLQHGLLDSSATWVSNEPSQSLGFILADVGYDVWLGNSRGNTYSRQHEKYTTSDSQFWDFSFDDMAHHDLPAVIDYILKQTNESKVAYAGHSQGTIQMFIALSSLGEEFQNKIAIFNALAPVAYVGNQASILLDLLVKFNIDIIVNFFGIKEFLPNSQLFQFLAKAFCGPFPYACEDFIFLLCGFNRDPQHNLNATRMPVYISNTPAGTSVKNMLHWTQLVRSSKFQRYDYGEAQNLIKYGQLTPPSYNLANLKVNRLALFTGTNDDLADPKDVLRLIGEIQPTYLHYIHNEETYQHLDFTWGVDCKDKIYPLIAQQINIAFNQLSKTQQ